ncbi:serine/threonine-protein phosphatase 7 long form-like protein, partial [Trifolium medium]|nr:serine/threonine-protein phosphatase 7 long form-like protein [Trifolium medium]
ATFVERWHEETNNFHMPSGEMTVTLDDVRCLMYFPIQERLLDYKSIPTNIEGVGMMMEYMGSTNKEAGFEVKTTKGAHA